MPDLFKALPDPVRRGADLAVAFTDPDGAGSSVVVKINDLEGRHDQIKVSLSRDAGFGTATWRVPQDWGAHATLSCAGSDDHDVAVV